MAALKPIVFRLGNELYGVDISKVIGIEKDQTVVRVPNSSTCIKGIINLRGSIIPVYSLREKFKMPPCPNEIKLIVVKCNDMMIALEVDEVQEINDLVEENIKGFPRIALNPDTRFFRNVANVGGKLILIIDVDDLLTREEEENAKQLIEE